MITKLLNEVNEKIETLNNLVQNKEYFEKLDERIEKVNNYGQEQKQENERLHSIIKEVREYIEENQEEHKYTDRGGFTYTEGHFLRDSDTLLEILDKENNNVKD